MTVRPHAATATHRFRAAATWNAHSATHGPVVPGRARPQRQAGPAGVAILPIKCPDCVGRLTKRDQYRSKTACEGGAHFLRIDCGHTYDPHDVAKVMEWY